MHREYDIVIVGGGQAGRRAAEGARSANPQASIAVLGEEPHIPYDRPELSKKVLLGEDPAICFPCAADDYRTARIELRLGQRARRIDPLDRLVVTEDGNRYRYARLILATGSTPRRPNAPADPRIVTLRTLEDAESLSGRLRPGRPVAIVGAGFIGLEVAAAARRRECAVSVFEAGPRVMSRTAPEIVSPHVENIHRGRDVMLHYDAPVTDVRTGPHGVSFHAGGVRHEADVLVVGIGIVPNTGLAEDAGLAVADGIVVDDRGRTSDPRIFAAGEVAAHPVLGSQTPMRLESWHVAEYQAENAGRNAAGGNAAHRVAPWFWSDQYEHNIQSLGLFGPDDRLIPRRYDGRSVSFIALDPENRLKGAVSIDAGKDIAAARRMLQSGQILDPARTADPATPLKAAVS